MADDYAIIDRYCFRRLAFHSKSASDICFKIFHANTRSPYHRRIREEAFGDKMRTNDEPVAEPAPARPCGLLTLLLKRHRRNYSQHHYL